jgi:TonB-dependent SusC/RagA subfamily outer membrane receptor
MKDYESNFYKNLFINYLIMNDMKKIILMLARNKVAVSGMLHSLLLKVWVCLLAFLTMGNAFGQTNAVSGIVLDGATNEPLIGVSVAVKGTGTGNVSDLNGVFTLNVSSDAILVVSYIGYVTKEVSVNGQRNLTILLSEDTKALEEVIVVGYGTQIRRNVTGAMETVKFEELSDIPVAQFTQKLQGQIAGVQINQGTGLPGQGMNVRIRGSASLSTSSGPLYVVDGFPIVGDINNINPSEIESMTILKDAAATSLYGSRAAFGVVLITTKGAKAGKTRVNVNAYTA